MTSRRAGLAVTGVAALGLFGAAGPADAAIAHQERAYAAVSFVPSISTPYFVAGASRDEAVNGAQYICGQFGATYANYQNDCQVAAWVHNGWVAIAGDGSFTPGEPSGPWGAGWGDTDERARTEAATVCRRFGGQTCTDHGSQQTPTFDPNQPTEGG